MLQTALGDAGEVELATNGLFQARLPVVRIDEIAVDGVFDGELKAVGRGRERRGVHDGRLEIFQLGFRVAERVGLQGNDVEPGGADERLQREEVREREDLDAVIEGAQRGPDVEVSDDQQAEISVAAHDSRQRGRDDLEIAVVGRRAAEIADGLDALRWLWGAPCLPDVRRSLQLRVVEKVGYDPRGELCKIFDAL